MNSFLQYIVLAALLSSFSMVSGQAVLYTMPGEHELHEGTWIQWPHNNLYGPFYKGDVGPTFIEMTKALQTDETVHIIAYDSTELNDIKSKLNGASVPLNNIDFHLFETDDVWSRDNGQMYVYDTNDVLTILDWGFNGWGFDTPYSKCDVIPQKVASATGIPRVDLSAMVLEGGAIEHDGHGTMMATRSSVTHSSRNPNLTETQIEDYLATYMGITNFIWLDGIYGIEITDMHIDGFVKFANDSTIVTMDSVDLDYWYVTPAEMNTIYTATNKNGKAYNIVKVPLTQNDVTTSWQQNLGYKGSYVNYYIGNKVVLIPTYKDPNDTVAINIIQNLYPNRTAVGIDVRNLYEYGGMIHCITQQQPVAKVSTSIKENAMDESRLLQNAPNPFTAQTKIGYDLNPGEQGILKVFNTAGQLVLQTPLNANKNAITLDAQNQTPGVYFYSLEVDGELIGSRRMVVE